MRSNGCIIRVCATPQMRKRRFHRRKVESRCRPEGGRQRVEFVRVYGKPEDVSAQQFRLRDCRFPVLVGEPFHFIQITRDGIGEITKALWRDDGIGQP